MLNLAGVVKTEFVYLAVIKLDRNQLTSPPCVTLAQRFSTESALKCFGTWRQVACLRKTSQHSRLSSVQEAHPTTTTRTTSTAFVATCTQYVLRYHLCLEGWIAFGVSPDPDCRCSAVVIVVVTTFPLDFSQTCQGDWPHCVFYTTCVYMLVTGVRWRERDHARPILI